MSPSNPTTTGPQQGGFHFKYTVQKGYFAQSEDATNDRDFDFVNIPLSPPSLLFSRGPRVS
jgi:hypothetical protein